MAIEIVSFPCFPINSMVIFHRYVSLAEATSTKTVLTSTPGMRWDWSHDLSLDEIQNPQRFLKSGTLNHDVALVLSKIIKFDQVCMI